MTPLATERSRLLSLLQVAATRCPGEPSAAWLPEQGRVAVTCTRCAATLVLTGQPIALPAGRGAQLRLHAVMAYAAVDRWRRRYQPDQRHHAPIAATET